MATTTNAHYKLPVVRNEPNIHYAPGSAERQKLQDALEEMQAAAPFQVPAFVGGKEVRTHSRTMDSDSSMHQHADRSPLLRR